MPSAFAPGRVTLMGDHTDYAGGLSVAIATQLGTTAAFTPDQSGSLKVLSDSRVLSSTSQSMVAGLLKTITKDGHSPRGTVNVTSTLPQRVGLSSSASFLVALALSLGIEENPLDLAQRCQRAEAHSGQKVGLLDQLTILLGEAATAVRLDFSDLTTSQIPLSHSWTLTALHSGITRSLGATQYAQRRRECEAVRNILGPLAQCSLDDINNLSDKTLRSRARHVLSESHRVDAMVEAICQDDLSRAGALMNESHRSLSQDFEVSLPKIDVLAQSVRALEGVIGVRLSGGGFGGCFLVLSESPVDLSAHGTWWPIQASNGAKVSETF